MYEKQKRSMTIHFNDGSKMLLQFPTPVPDDDVNLAVRVKEALDARHLILEADGSLFVIPVGSIKYLQCFPAPKTLPTHAIKGVRFKD
jgi:hypothetical protein